MAKQSHPKLDEKTLDAMFQLIPEKVKLPKIQQPIQPIIIKDGWQACCSKDPAFKMHDKRGYCFSYCKACGQRYYEYLVR